MFKLMLIEMGLSALNNVLDVNSKSKLNRRITAFLIDQKTQQTVADITRNYLAFVEEEENDENI